MINWSDDESDSSDVSISEAEYAFMDMISTFGRCDGCKKIKGDIYCDVQTSCGKELRFCDDCKDYGACDCDVCIKSRYDYLVSKYGTCSQCEKRTGDICCTYTQTVKGEVCSEYMSFNGPKKLCRECTVKMMTPDPVYIIKHG